MVTQTLTGQTSNIFTCSEGPASLRPRYYDPTTGRFNRLDPFKGNRREPLSLHKYAYCHGDPVNNIDPSGMFSITSFAVTGGIIGGLIGSMLGAYIGSNGFTEFSWKTVGYAAMGAATGAAAGVMIGSTIGFMVNGGLIQPNAIFSVTRMSSKLVQQIARPSMKLFAKKGYGTLKWFASGVVAGVATQLVTPNRFDDWLTPASLLSLPADTAVLTILNHLRHASASKLEVTLPFVAGFNIGYFGSRELGLVTPKIERKLWQFLDAAVEKA